MKRNKKPNKRIKITIKSKEGRKKLDKKNFWLSLVTLLFVLISLQILFFATGRKDQKGIYDVQAGALCGQGTYQYNGCTACDMPPGWTYCGGGLTYECGTVCLHPSCGAAACSGPPCTPNCTGATCTFPACPTNYDVGNTECSTTTVSCNPGDGCGGTCPAINRTCWLVKRTATYDGNGGSCSVSRYDSCHGTASDTPSCSRAGHTLSGFSLASGSTCGGTFNTSTGVCSSMTSNITIKANWTINQYLVTISNGGGGTCTGSTTNVPYGSPSPTPGCSNRVGYILSGYSLSSGTCGGTFNTSTGVCSSVTGPITVVANWSPAQENPITSWFSSSWLYRSPIYVSGSGTVVSNAEVLVIVNTASLISSNKMQSTCNDMRFVDSNDTTAISFWIEGGCNTTTTRVWVRIPSLPTTGKTIYMYYGNPSASNAELPWTGGFIVLSTSACPTGWTRDANFDSRFPLSHESYGSKAGNSTHGHTVPSFTLTGNDAPAFMDTWGGATDYSSKTGHTHTVTISVSNASTLPPYTTMLFCKANDLNLFSGSVVMDKTGSVGNYYSALNDRFPYGSTSSGTQGGSNTHTHSIPQTTSTAASLNGSSITHPGSGPDPGALVATVTHTHIVSAATTNAASNLPPYYSLRYITLTTYGNIPSIITMGDSVPPLGWSRLTNFDSRLPYGSSNIGSTGGSASHNHTGSVTIQGVSNRVWRYEGGHGGGSYSAQQHTHQGTVSYTTSTYNSYPPYMSTLFIERKTSTSTSLQPEQKYNAAPSAPTNLKLDNNSTTPLVGVTNTTPSFSAKFNDPDAGDVGTHYQIQVNTNNSFTGTTMWDSGQISMPNLANGSQSQNITYGGSTIALNGSTYYWRIRFWDNNGAVSQYSSVFSFTMIDVPSAPLNPSVVSGNTQITLTWNIPSSDGGSSITDYIVQYSTDGNTWDTFDDGVSTSTTATVTDLTNGTQYYFRVAAVNGAGIGPYTASVTATPVNQIPIFTGQAYNTPVNPGDTVTWSATASDSDGQVKLLVCKTPGITASGTCSGNTWCSSSLVSSNPSCSYSVPNPTVNNTYNAYVYIVDNQNEPATGAMQGTNSSFVVSSVAPIVTGITLNGGSAINLVENNTKSVTITATVSSDNSCTTISSVTGYLYRSGIGYTGCDSAGESNGNNCYPEISCTVDSGSCTDSTDKTADYTCVVNVQYFADPTDTGTLYDSQNWLARIKATNSGDLSTSTEVTTGVEMNSLTAFSVTSTLNYGDLLVGGSNSPLDRILITTATGNVGLDQEHKGEEIGMCTDYPTCTVGTPIVLSHQKYSLTASTPYSTPTTAISLTNTSVEVELNLAKPTSTTAVSKNTWWGVFIPPGTLPGYYQGRNTITAVKGETTHW